MQASSSMPVITMLDANGQPVTFMQIPTGMSAAAAQKKKKTKRKRDTKKGGSKPVKKKKTTAKTTPKKKKNTRPAAPAAALIGTANIVVPQDRVAEINALLASPPVAPTAPFVVVDQKDYV
jgi:hypothetical protein